MLVPTPINIEEKDVYFPADIAIGTLTPAEQREIYTAEAILFTSHLTSPLVCLWVLISRIREGFYFRGPVFPHPIAERVTVRSPPFP